MASCGSLQGQETGTARPVGTNRERDSDAEPLAARRAGIRAGGGRGTRVSGPARRPAAPRPVSGASQDHSARRVQHPGGGHEADVMHGLAGPGEEVQVAGPGRARFGRWQRGLLVVGVARHPYAEHPADRVDQAGAVQPVRRGAAPQVPPSENSRDASDSRSAEVAGPDVGRTEAGAASRRRRRAARPGRGRRRGRSRRARCRRTARGSGPSAGWAVQRGARRVDRDRVAGRRAATPRGGCSEPSLDSRARRPRTAARARRTSDQPSRSVRTSTGSPSSSWVSVRPCNPSRASSSIESHQAAASGTAATAAASTSRGASGETQTVLTGTRTAARNIPPACHAEPDDAQPGSVRQVDGRPS